MWIVGYLKEVSKYVCHSLSTSSRAKQSCYISNYLVMQLFVYFLLRYLWNLPFIHCGYGVLLGGNCRTGLLCSFLCCISFWTGMFSVWFFPPSLFSLLSRFLLSEWRFFPLSALALHCKSQPSGEKTANNSPNTKQQR